MILFENRSLKTNFQFFVSLTA